MKKIFAIAALFMQISLAATSYAASTAPNSFDFRNTFQDFQEGLQEQSQDLESGVEGITLPTYQEGLNSEDGTAGIVNAIRSFLDLFKLIVAPVAVMFIIIMGVRMVNAGRESEDVLTKSKNYIRYATEGLLAIFLADSVVEVMFGAEGEIFRGGEAGAAEFGRRSATLFEGLYGFGQVLIGSIAVFVLVTAGMRYVGGSFSDDQIAGAKKQITWALVGLFVVGISEFVAKDILFRNRGTELGVDAAQQLFAQVTNFVAGTMGTLAFAAMIYAGYLYVAARDNEDNVAKAKKIIVGAIIGLILAAAAFAITNTIVELDATR